MILILNIKKSPVNQTSTQDLEHIRYLEAALLDAQNQLKLARLKIARLESAPQKMTAQGSEIIARCNAVEVMWTIPR